MPKGTVFDNDLMKLIFQATPNISLLLDNTATTPLTVLYLSLHTADPSAGTQLTSETTYTSYARVTVARTSGGWSVAANVVQPVATIAFPAGTGGSGTVTHFGIGTVTTGGAGKILYSGTVTPNIVVGNGVTPQLTTASTITET
jgi:hypothetical protein